MRTGKMGLLRFRVVAMIGALPWGCSGSEVAPDENQASAESVGPGEPAPEDPAIPSPAPVDDQADPEPDDQAASEQAMPPPGPAEEVGVEPDDRVAPEEPIPPAPDPEVDEEPEPATSPVIPEPGGLDVGMAGASGTGGQPAVPEPISFSQVEQEVFEPAGCTAGYCHGGSAGDLTWAYEALVSMAAAKPVCGLTDRVVPFDPESSILWARIRPVGPEDTEPCAETMPAGGPPLDPEQSQLVYDWILGGAAP